MNYVMDYRLIYCLRNGLPLDMDVYDAAEWSCITELSEKSVLNGSIPVEIPDFTRGSMENKMNKKKILFQEFQGKVNMPFYGFFHRYRIERQSPDKSMFSSLAHQEYLTLPFR